MTIDFNNYKDGDALEYAYHLFYHLNEIMPSKPTKWVAIAAMATVGVLQKTTEDKNELTFYEKVLTHLGIIR